MIDNKIESLVEPFRTKVQVFMNVVRKKYPEIYPFETKRSYKRQLLLFTQRKSWTLKSYHLQGKAVDWVFMRHWQPSWSGDYNHLQWIAGMCGMERIKQESCHTQDNGNPIAVVMSLNSSRYKSTKSPEEQKRLHDVNEEFRKFGYK